MCIFPLAHSDKIPIIQAIKDWILLVIIGIVVGVDITLLLLGTAIPETRLNATLVVDEEHKVSVDVSFLEEGVVRK